MEPPEELPEVEPEEPVEEDTELPELELLVVPTDALLLSLVVDVADVADVPEVAEVAELVELFEAALELRLPLPELEPALTWQSMSMQIRPDGQMPSGQGNGPSGAPGTLRQPARSIAVAATARRITTTAPPPCRCRGRARRS